MTHCTMYNLVSLQILRIGFNNCGDRAPGAFQAHVLKLYLDSVSYGASDLSISSETELLKIE